MSQYVLLVFEDESSDLHGETAQELFLRRFAAYRGLRDQVGARVAVELFLTPDEEEEIRKRRNEA